MFQLVLLVMRQYHISDLRWEFCLTKKNIYKKKKELLKASDIPPCCLQITAFLLVLLLVVLCCIDFAYCSYGKWQHYSLNNLEHTTFWKFFAVNHWPILTCHFFQITVSNASLQQALQQNYGQETLHSKGNPGKSYQNSKKTKVLKALKKKKSRLYQNKLSLFWCLWN